MEEDPMRVVLAVALAVLLCPIPGAARPGTASAEPAEAEAGAGLAEAAPAADAVPRPDHSVFDRLLAKYVTPYGVRYASWNESAADREALVGYLQHLQSLPVSEIRKLEGGREEALAYWINLYNAATLQLVLGGYPVDSIKDLGNLIRTPWKRKVVKVEGLALSLDEIENDIIRPRFGDPRIHFALNCAAIGCPPLLDAAYLPDRLDAQLERQTQLFLGDPKRNGVDAEEGKLYLSKIFDWYEEDFVAAAGSVRAYVMPHLPALQEIKPSRELEVVYRDYDWSLNEAPERR
jgi:hypothetical protein